MTLFDLIPIILFFLFFFQAKPNFFKNSPLLLGLTNYAKRKSGFYVAVWFGSGLLVFLTLTFGMLFGLVNYLGQFTSTIDFTRTPHGQSLPSGTYSGWSFTLFFLGMAIFFGSFSLVIGKALLARFRKEST